MKTMEAFYLECIGSKIAQCDRKAMRFSGRSACTQVLADFRRAQVVFFEDMKENLVMEMLAMDIGRDLNKISEFLNRAFLAKFGGHIQVPAGGQTDESSIENLPGNLDGCLGDEDGRRKISAPVLPSCSERCESMRIERLFELPWSDGTLLSEEE